MVVVIRDCVSITLEQVAWTCRRCLQEAMRSQFSQGGGMRYSPRRRSTAWWIAHERIESSYLEIIGALEMHMICLSVIRGCFEAFEEGAVC